MDNKQNKASESDTRLRILYLYQLLLRQTDEEHTLSTQQIMAKMKELHNISMHRTTVSSDIALLRAAGFEIMTERTKGWNYYMTERTFSVPELKVLIDAVQSSKFITDRKSQVLIDKLVSLTSDTNAAKLRRTIHATGRIKSENEKGYYIVDSINEAINEERKISFCSFEYDGNKNHILKNDGNPYTVSPYDLLCDGDYYYLIGYCDERNAVRAFRVDRIEHQPKLLDEEIVPRPSEYDISYYTQQVFRMFDTQDSVTVELLCKNEAMRFIIDQFGEKANTEPTDEEHFKAEVAVSVGPTFYRWLFGFSGKIKLIGPDAVLSSYREMLRMAMEDTTL